MWLSALCVVSVCWVSLWHLLYLQERCNQCSFVSINVLESLVISTVACNLQVAVIRAVRPVLLSEAWPQGRKNRPTHSCHHQPLPLSTELPHVCCKWREGGNSCQVRRGGGRSESQPAAESETAAWWLTAGYGGTKAATCHVSGLYTGRSFIASFFFLFPLLHLKPLHI